MRSVVLATLILGLVASPASAQRYQRQDPLYQPLKPATERALSRARQLNARQAYAAAIAEYDKVVAQQPGFAKAITERAFVKESIGDYAGAMADHDLVLSLAPGRANACSHAAWIRALRDIELDLALDYARKGVALGAGIDPVDTRAFVRFRRGEGSDALADYDAVLKVYPRSASTIFMRGVVRRRMGDVAGGDADLAQARKLDKTVETLWARRGVTPWALADQLERGLADQAQGEPQGAGEHDHARARHTAMIEVVYATHGHWGGLPATFLVLPRRNGQGRALDASGWLIFLTPQP